MNAHFNSEGVQTGLGNVVTATLAAGQVQLFTSDWLKQQIEGQRVRGQRVRGQRVSVKVGWVGLV